MSRLSICTPCPPPSNATSSLNRRLSTISTDNTCTAEIDYTRAVELDIVRAKPRRKSTFQRKGRNEPAITIFEDVLEEEDGEVKPRSTLLGKPARKVGRSFHGVRRPGAELEKVGENEISLREPGVVERNARLDGPNAMQSGLKKEPRRRTIFVPNEDTTLLTIHPGAQTTERLNDTFQLPNLAQQRAESQDHGSVAVGGAVKRPRLSLSVAPKRAPLHSIVADTASNCAGRDVVGQNGGKENLPPGNTVVASVRCHDDVAMAKAESLQCLQRRTTLHRPTAASKARQSLAPRAAVPLSSATTRKEGQASMLRGQDQQSSQNGGRTRQLAGSVQHAPHTTRKLSSMQRVPPTTGASRPSVRKQARLSQFPVLSEDLARPELYEDNWLTHQEVALAEVINQLLSDAEPRKRSPTTTRAGLREQMMNLYHQENVSSLHQRLHASLLYGALCRPRDAPKPPDPALDIGLRKRFLGLWLDSYDADLLRAATEVVFGRQIPASASPSTGTCASTLDSHATKRSLISFLETFLVDVEDVEEPIIERGDDPYPRWRKMVQRSLMLIWLLDRAHTLADRPRCLFKRTSHRKSSTAVLQTLTTLLIPSIGDILKTLRHLDYEVEYVQDPLDEVRYRIDNIAVDLRDGILLTRLVEVLIFARRIKQQPDATITIRMPNLTILETMLAREDGTAESRVLSQHLKMPCIGRAQKVYNVDIALSALRDHGRLLEGTGDITADDVVNGHREKTLGLLWSLVSTYGLGQLLDFEELVRNIKRSAPWDAESLTFRSDVLSQQQQESLLKKWACLHCAAQGVRVSSLTTAFSDGQAYSAILRSFASGLSASAHSEHCGPSSDSDVRRHLSSFGCSQAFMNQIVANSHTIPSRRTTISNLAFLASRLLPHARSHHAAVSIQRAFRTFCHRRLVSQRVILLRLAHACAAVVATQARVAAAVITIQRAWREVVRRRLARMNEDVRLFQCMAYGWMSRQRVQQQRCRSSFRVMGGW